MKQTEKSLETEMAVQKQRDDCIEEEAGKLGEFGESMARPLQAFGRLVLRDPLEHGWDLIPENIILGEE